MRRAFCGVPRKGAPQRKTPCAEPPKGGERRGFPQNHEIFFCQLKRKFVNSSFLPIFRKSQNRTFDFFPIRRRGGAPKEVNAKILIIREPLNIFAEGKNAVSRRRAAVVP